MAIHEGLTRIPKPRLREVGWSKAAELARRDGKAFDCATWLHRAKELPKEEFKREVERHLTGKRDRALGAALLQSLQEPVAGDRASPGNDFSDAGKR
jgi:hypothetical protein